MLSGAGYTVRRMAPVPDPSLVGISHDYADSFAVDLEVPDARSPEYWARTALEQAPCIVRGLIRVAQARVLRLRLRPRTDTDAVLGWPIASSTQDTLHLRATGHLLRADIVVRRVSGLRFITTTSLVYKRRSASTLWMFVGPLHRCIKPYLLGRAAAALTASS